MAGLTPMSAAQLDSLLAQSYAAACERAGIPVIDLAGGQFGAFFYAVRQALLQQGTQLAYAVQVSRLQTCVTTEDVASFLASFDFPLLSATYAQGGLLCTTPGPIASPGLVPIGARFGTGSLVAGQVTFVCVADPLNPAYSQAQGGYVITPTGTAAPSTVTITVQCETAGSVGNVATGQITQLLAGPIVALGIASVTNPAAFASAQDVESPAAAKVRFQAKFTGGDDALLAIYAAILGVEAGLTASAADCTFTDGTERDGWVTYVVNQAGATTPTSTQLIQQATTAVDTLRSGGYRRAIIGSTVETVAIGGHLVFASGADIIGGTALAVNAVTAYLNGIGLDPQGAPTVASPAQIYRAIMTATATSANPGGTITDVQGLTLNGGTSELTAPFAVQFVAGAVTFA